MNEEKKNATDNEQQIANEEEVANLTEVLTGLMRVGEKLLVDAVPQGPEATLMALTVIIDDLQKCWDFVAGIVVPNCGNPNCTVHGTLATHAPTESELHDETGAGANTNEQPVSDSDHYYDDLDDDTD